MFGSTVEKPWSLAMEAIPAFGSEFASSSKILHELEKYLSKLDKEPDADTTIFKQKSEKFVNMAPEVRKDLGMVTPLTAMATLKK